jgi:hypothetical protein
VFIEQFYNMLSYLLHEYPLDTGKNRVLTDC